MGPQIFPVLLGGHESVRKKLLGPTRWYLGENTVLNSAAYVAGNRF